MKSKNKYKNTSLQNEGKKLKLRKIQKLKIIDKFKILYLYNRN